ncbi:hypothetical protein D3C85_1323120 [compost metagenome]
MIEIGRDRVGENSLDGPFQFRLVRTVLGLASGTRSLLDDGTSDRLEQRRPRVVDFSIDLCAGANLHGNHFLWWSRLWKNAIGRTLPSFELKKHILACAQILITSRAGDS